MTENNGFKKMVRARMRVTNESYMTAERRLMFTGSFFKGGFVAPEFKDYFLDDVTDVTKRLLGEMGALIVAGSSGQYKTTTMLTMAKWLAAEKHSRNIWVEETSEVPELSDDYVHVVANASSPVDEVFKQSLRMLNDALFYGEIRGSFIDSFWLTSKLIPTVASVHSSPIDYPSLAGQRVMDLAERNGEKAFSPACVSGFFEQCVVRDDVNPEHRVLLQNVIVNTPEVSEVLFGNAGRVEILGLLEDMGVVTLASKVDQLEDEGKIKFNRRTGNVPYLVY